MPSSEPLSEPLQILLAHNRWATAQILETCQKLTTEQFHQPFEMGPGSLHNATSHILGAMLTWTETLAGKDFSPRPDQDGRRRSAAELLELLDAYAANLTAEAYRLPLDETVSRVREGRSYSFTRGAVVTHVTTHGMHHRAQCLNMLRQLGVKPLPPSGVSEWTRTADAAG